MYVFSVQRGLFLEAQRGNWISMLYAFDQGSTTLSPCEGSVLRPCLNLPFRSILLARQNRASERLRAVIEDGPAFSQPDRVVSLCAVWMSACLV